MKYGLLDYAKDLLKPAALCAWSLDRRRGIMVARQSARNQF